MKRVLVLSMLLVACGKDSGTSAPRVIPPTPGDISVQLNDFHNQIFASESVQISDSRFFTPPDQILAVNGTFSGLPSQYIRARIKLSTGAVCEYENVVNTDNCLYLRECSGVSIGVDNLLPSGTIIELENYDVPGRTIEVHFVLKGV